MEDDKNNADMACVENIRVLVVDDEAIVRECLRAMVKALGVRHVYEAADAHKAIQIYAEKKIDIVLLDIRMPDVDGLSVLNTINRMDPNAFVVMVTGDNSVDNVQQSIRQGAKGYVIKPFSAEKIADVVNKYIVTSFSVDQVIHGHFKRNW